MILRNYNYAFRYFNLQSNIEFENTEGVKVDGWYDIYQGVIYALFVKDSKLYISLGDDVYLVTEKLKVYIFKCGKSKLSFEVKSSDNMVFKCIYEVEKRKPIFSPFEYIEEVSWWGFLKEVVNSKERRANFISNIIELKN